MKLTKENITGAATSVLLDVGKDALAAFAPELYAAVTEYFEQRKTPDGWTELEYLTWLHGAIGRVKAKQIGPGWFDHVVDWGLQAWQMKIAKRIDALEPAATPPVVEEPAPAKPYYLQLMLTNLTAAVRDELGIDTATDQLWWNQATNHFAVRYTITPIDGTCWPGWAKIAWA